MAVSSSKAVPEGYGLPSGIRGKSAGGGVPRRDHRMPATMSNCEVSGICAWKVAWAEKQCPFSQRQTSMDSPSMAPERRRATFSTRARSGATSPGDETKMRTGSAISPTRPVARRCPPSPAAGRRRHHRAACNVARRTMSSDCLASRRTAPVARSRFRHRFVKIAVASDRLDFRQPLPGSSVAGCAMRASRCSRECLC